MSVCCCCETEKDWLETKVIQSYDGKGNGMFPICCGCYNKLSTKEILYYCQMLIDMWKGLAVDENEKDSYDQIRKNESEYLRRCEQFIRRDKKEPLDLPVLSYE